MQNSLREDEGPDPDSVETESVILAEDRVSVEPFDEHGIILLETRMGADGKIRTRKINRHGFPILTQEDLAQMDFTEPYDPDF